MSNPLPYPGGILKPEDSSGDLWRALPAELWLLVASCLPPNEVACALRLVNKAAGVLLSAPEHLTIDLSKPVPPDIFAGRWGSPDAMRSLTLERRKEFVVLTAASGVLANLKVALGAYAGICSDPDVGLFRAAAKGGNLEACNLLWQQVNCAGGNAERNLVAMRAAADAGKYDICSWLHEEHGQPWPYSADVHIMGTAAMCTAAGADQLGECRRLHEQYGMPYTEAVMIAAVRTGGLALCQSLQRAGSPCGQLAFKAAAQEGHSAICGWLLGGGFVTYIAAAAAAAQVGKAALMTQLLDEAQARADSGGPVKWWSFVLPSAAEGCDLQTLQALFDRARAESGRISCVAPHTQSWILAAAISSSTSDWHVKAQWLMTQPGFRAAWDKTKFPLEIRIDSWQGVRAEALAGLTWLRDEGFIHREGRLEYYAERLLSCVARQGDAAGIDLLLEAGVTADTAVSDAICCGQWEEVRLLLSRGCQPSSKNAALLLAGLGRSMEAMERFLECLGPELVLTRTGLLAAAEYGNVPLLAWLVDRHGVVLDGGALEAAARGGCVEALEWLVERGCDVRAPGSAYVFCARNGDLLTLACLRRLGCPFAPSTFAEACIRSPLPALRWLVEEGAPLGASWTDAVSNAKLFGKAGVVEWLAGLPRNRRT